jgi:hypothetical protein
MTSMGIVDLFLSNEVYLSKVRDFDDPFESRPMLKIHDAKEEQIEYLIEITKEVFPNENANNIRMLVESQKHRLYDNKFLRNVYNNFIDKNGIYCLSENNNDIILWSLYSNAHKGFCLEFNSSIEGTLFYEALKVNYTEKYPIVNMMDMNNENEVQKALLTKYNKWNNQEEWRIIKTEIEGGGGLYKFKPELLTGIIFGALMEEKDKNTLIKYIEHYPIPINLYQAQLNEKIYQIDIVSIT